MTLPRLLVLDDLFGRDVPDGRNVDRENLCALFLWRDQTGDTAAAAARQEILKPTAAVVFARAQTPSSATVGDMVENDLEAALKVVESGWPFAPSQSRQPTDTRWALLLLDLCFYTGPVTAESHRRAPGMPIGRPDDDDPMHYFGLTLLDIVHAKFPLLPICILSSKPRVDVSLEFSRRGALGFIARDDPRAPEVLQETLWQHGLLSDTANSVTGESLPLLLTLREARRAGGHRENLLIRGERGTGKESLAGYVNRTSGPRTQRGPRPLVTVNSAVFTATLFASELFGIQPRTATGVDGKIGLIESADGGDLFLDEIADLPTEAQGAILRVLQEHQITPVGARRPKPVSVRFLSATNRDIDDPELGLRADLLDRLRSGGTLWLPPLRERLVDIPLLVDKFLREAEGRRKGALHRQITDDALEVLITYSWPGNVRELRSVVVDAVNRYPDVEYLVPEHLRLTAAKSPADRTAHVYVRRVARAAADTAGDDLTLEELMRIIQAFDFDPRVPERWAGRFGELQRVIADLLARHIRAALLASKRPTPDQPRGEILIHPAMKLLTGDRSLSASKAADIIKKALSFSLAAKDVILQDETLQEAHRIATRLRPTSANKRRSGSS